MKLELKFGTAVTVIPAAAAEKIISGAATAAETAVLLAVAREPETETNTDSEYIQVLSEITGLDTDTVNAALAFWRGAAVLSPSGKSRNSSRTHTRKAAPNTEDAVIPAKTAENTLTATESNVVSPTHSLPIGTADKDILGDISGAQSAKSVSEELSAEITPSAGGRKALMREELPQYAPEVISDICGRNGGALRAVIEQCQQIIGRIFNTMEVEKIVALNDYLGLDPEYILTLFAYYSKKKPGCKLHYIEKTAYTLVSEGITNIAELDAHIKSMETYDGVAGQLRKLLGIGGRAFTKKENTKISHWINDLGYGSEIIEYCYEITVNNIGEFDFDYADKVIEGWYTEGVKTVDNAKAAIEKYKMEHERKQAVSNAPGGITESTFDGDEFLALAIKRSLDNF